MKVILATDGSEHAEEAAVFLSRVAFKQPIELRLLSVIRLPDLHHLLGNHHKQSFINKCRKTVDESLDRLEGILKPYCSQVERCILEGHPGQEIVEQAKLQSADLVVVGAVGSSLVDRILLGSTGEYVATQSPCSVLVVRAPKHTVQNKWLVAYDGSPPSKAAFDFAADHGLFSENDVEIAQIVPEPPTLLNDDDLTVIRDVLERDAKQAISDLLAGHDLTEVALEVVESSHPGNEICELAEKQQSKAVVMGSTGKGMVARILVGSVSRHVLHHAPCSVLIGRSSDDSHA